MPASHSIARVALRTSLAMLTAVATACAVASTIRASRSGASPKSEHQVGFPAELYARSIPPDNPQTPAKIALGQALFVEQRLSADNLQHCEGCHNYALGFTDQKKTSVGIDQQAGRRNAPTILNAMFNTSQFWDGRAQTLEEQRPNPLILNPIEMGMKSPDEVVAKIKAMPRYSEAFERVFGREVNFDDIARALASYERTQISFDSPFDHYIAGAAATTLAPASGDRRISKARLENFQRQWPMCRMPRLETRASTVHRRAFPQRRRIIRRRPRTQSERDNLPVGDDSTPTRRNSQADSGMSDLGQRYLVTRKPTDIGAFRTPDLRNLLVTQPYFHDGSAATLWNVVAHFNQGGVHNPFLDSAIVPLDLSKADEDDLVAFLATLTSPEYERAAKAEYHRPFRISRDAISGR